MPVYNGEAYLAEAIDSILAQTERRFEFLIIDDGSTDRSLDIARDRAARDDRIRVVALEHAGIVAALNAGLAMAQGEFVARMDADDVALPHRFAVQLQHLAEHPRTVAVGGNVVFIRPDGSLHGRTNHVLHASYNANSPMESVLVPHPAAMYRLAPVRALGGYRKPFRGAQDTDLWRRLIEIGDIDNLEEPVLHYRLHAAQATTVSRHLHELFGGIAVALAQCRMDIGHEAGFDVEASLTPEDAEALAAGWPPRAAALAHIALGRYYFRTGDLQRGAKFTALAARAHPPLLQRQDVQGMLARMVGQATRQGQLATALGLLALAPGPLAGWVIGRGTARLKRAVRRPSPP